MKLCSEPVREIELLHEAPQSWNNQDLDPGTTRSSLAGDLWDIFAEIEPAEAKEVGFRIRGRKVSVTVLPKERRLNNGESSVGISPAGAGRVKLRILVDRTSIEVFANDGEWVMPCCFVPKLEDQSLSHSSRKGDGPASSACESTVSNRSGLIYHNIAQTR